MATKTSITIVTDDVVQNDDERSLFTEKSISLVFFHWSTKWLDFDAQLRQATKQLSPGEFVLLLLRSGYATVYERFTSASYDV